MALSCRRISDWFWSQASRGASLPLSLNVEKSSRLRRFVSGAAGERLTVAPLGPRMWLVFVVVGDAGGGWVEKLEGGDGDGGARGGGDFFDGGGEGVFFGGVALRRVEEGDAAQFFF